MDQPNFYELRKLNSSTEHRGGLKFALYARVSTDEQNNEQQIDRLVSYAERKGYQYEVFEEKESTRKTRPVKQQVLSKLRGFELDGVIIWKLDRWARSSTELVTEIEELTNKGLLFVSLSDNIDLSSPSGRLQFQILAAFAEFERNLISERTKEGLKRAVKNGRKLGRPRKR